MSDNFKLLPYREGFCCRCGIAVLLAGDSINYKPRKHVCECGCPDSKRVYDTYLESRWDAEDRYEYGFRG